MSEVLVPSMFKGLSAVVVLLTLSAIALGQGTEGEFKLALPEHNGQLRWIAPSFKVVESSVKENGNEIGIRGANQATHLAFLGFLFLFPEQAPLTSGKCREGVLGPEKKSNPTLNVLESWDETGHGGLPRSLVKYTAQKADGTMAYMERGFIATGEICGDLEFYSDTPITAEETHLKSIFASYDLDQNYVPQYQDALLYAQMLYKSHRYAAAAPVFELALSKLRERPQGDLKVMVRVLTDQAGMAYGISGNTPKARALFEKAIADDPDYPLYYYNLACADAEQKDLKAARIHLQEAFERKANVVPGESMPDPTKDDSFLPYQSDKEFWAFLKTLGSKP